MKKFITLLLFFSNLAACSPESLRPATPPSENGVQTPSSRSEPECSAPIIGSGCLSLTEEYLATLAKDYLRRRALIALKKTK